MKPTSMVIFFLVICLSHDISSANGEQVAYRWRNDNGNVYSATWKDSANTPVALTDYENLRLRIEDLVGNADTSSISLRYTEDLYNANWIPITNDDTGRFTISPSQHLIDTMSYYDNQLLPPFYQDHQYRRTITIDSSVSYLLSSENGSIYEFEYSIKPTLNIQPGSAYFFSCFMDSAPMHSWELNEYAVLMTPPISWKTKVTNTSALNDVFFVNENNGCAIGGNKIIQTTDGGDNWFDKSISVSDVGRLNAMYFVNADVGWIGGTRSKSMGDEGIVMKTTNGGESWELQQVLGDISWLHDVSFSDENNGTVVGGTYYGGTVSGGTILRTTDGGENWTRQTSPYAYYEGGLSSVVFNQNIGMAVGWYGRIIKTTNGGQNWYRKDVGRKFHLNDVCLVDENVGVAVGQDENMNGGLILRTTNGGDTWTNIINGGVPALSHAYFADSDIGWVTGGCGWILKTTDGGMSWKKLTSGAYDDLSSIHFVDSETGWAVGGNKILKTTNGGITTSIDEKESEYIPANVFLAQNYPNPFNPSTTIKYELPQSSIVRLSVYDMLGREVSVLVNERRDAGVHEVKFDAWGLSSGVYFYRLQAGDVTQTKRLLLLR